jgi:hypothetical protein
MRLRREGSSGRLRRSRSRAARTAPAALVLAIALSTLSGTVQAAAVEVQAEIVYEVTTAFATPPDGVDPKRCVIVWFAQFDAVENDDARSYTATLADGWYSGSISDYTTFGPDYDDNYSLTGGAIVVPFPAPPGTHRKVLNSYSTGQGCDDALARTQGRWTLLAATADVPSDKGSITIVAQSEQTGPSEGFVFTGTSPIGTFGLDTDSASPLPDRRTFSDLDPATYTIQGTPIGGWQLADLTCRAARFALNATTDPATGTATVTLPRDETVTCTYGYKRATGLVVNSTRDLEDQVSSDETCDTGATITRNGAEEPECTLRAAIQEAGRQSGAQVIRFAIAGDPVIELASALPTVIGPVTIDGTSQGASASCGILPACVQVRSSLDAPVIEVAGQEVAIRGLHVVPTTSTAIRIGAGGGHTIEGNDLTLESADVSLAGVAGIDVVGAQGVTIADNDVQSRGPAIRLSTGSGHTVTGNHLTAGQLERAGRRVGIFVTGSSDITIGAGSGSTEADSGNTVTNGQVLVADSSSVTLRGNTLDSIDVESGTDVRIEGNRITGAVLVGERASGVVVGGATPTAGTGLGNHIVGDTLRAISLEGDGATILGNLVEGARGDGNCRSVGIRVEGDSNRIGGATVQTGNTIRGFDAAVLVQGSETLVAANVLEGNGVGLDVGGTTGTASCSGESRPPAIGTTVSSNVASNNGTGIDIDPNSSSTVVLGNRIGTNAAGTSAAPNGVGIWIAGPAVIGGSSEGPCTTVCNVISGNRGHGIVVHKDDFLGLNPVTIQGNIIGVASDGSTPLPNDETGIWLASGRSVMVGGAGSGEGNVIAHNGMEGIAVSWVGVPLDGYSHTIRGNRIHSNGRLGIDLGRDNVTPNDIGDEDVGANDHQNFPEWREVHRTLDGQVNINGRIPIHSTVQGTYLVDLYLNTRCDPLRHGEGEIPYATLSTTDFNEGFFSIEVPPAVVAGRFLTATATAPNGSTSEFSVCLDVEASLSEHALTAPAAAGATRLEVASEGLVGKVVAIGDGDSRETNYGTASGSLVLARPTRFAHAAGEPVVALDDTLFVSLDSAVITRSSKAPDVAALSGKLRAIAGGTIACGDDVTLTLDGGTVAQRVSGSRFNRLSGGRCSFVAKTEGGIGRFELNVSRGTWSAQVVRKDLERLTNPVEVGLTIGDDAGSESLRFRVAGQVWTYRR